MKGTVFEYRWWRFRDGLTHYESDDVSQLKQGSFLRSNGKWWVYGRKANSRGMATAMLSFYTVEDCMVPKEIRTLALLLNI